MPVLQVIIKRDSVQLGFSSNGDTTLVKYIIDKSLFAVLESPVLSLCSLNLCYHVGVQEEGIRNIGFICDLMTILLV